MKNCPTCHKTYPDDFTLCPRDGAALVEAGAWTEGAVVRGKYRILAKLGQGGMGAVCKAVHVRFGEIRALKVMSAQVAGDPLFVKRFEQEAVITRKLQHPNAVRVDDIDESDDGRPFIVMEFIEGKSLKRVIKSEGPLPVPRVCAIIKQVAAALGAAHELGMVHRDIKPDNIVLVASTARAAASATSPASLPASVGPGLAPAIVSEIAKVLDFGIAKLKEARATETAGLSLTGTGVIIGTPQYMSSEQAAGKRGDELDGRSDLYSLGVVMYEMLSGSLPFKSDTPMGMLVAHMHATPPPLKLLRPDLKIPDGIAAVVMKCLEKKPEQRPASAATQIAELERAEKQPPLPLAPTRIERAAVVGERSALPSSPHGAPAFRTENGRPEASPTKPPPGAPRPRAKEAPRQPAARLPQHPAAVSRWKVWAVVATFLIIVALGAWYILGTKGGSSNPGIENKGGAVSTPAGGASAPASGGRASGDTGNKGGSQIASPQPSQQPANQRSTTSASSKSNVAEKNRQPGGAAKPPPAKPAASQIDNAERQKQINAAKTEGDLYFENGEYDNAIVAYPTGLKADPTNAELRQKVQKARNAKATAGEVR